MEHDFNEIFILNSLVLIFVAIYLQQVMTYEFDSVSALLLPYFVCWGLHLERDFAYLSILVDTLWHY